MSKRRTLIFGGIVLLALGLLLDPPHPVNRLSGFLPEASGTRSRLILSQVKHGLDNHMILIGLTGAPVDQLVQASRRLQAELSRNPEFAAVLDHSPSPSALNPSSLRQEILFRYRYLLVPPPGAPPWSTAALHQDFLEDLGTLAGPAGPQFAGLLRRDPTGAWTGWLRQIHLLPEPPERHGVWFLRHPSMALLAAVLVHSGWNLSRDTRALKTIRQETRHAGLGLAHLRIGGVAAIATALSRRIHTRMTELAITSTLLLLIGLGLLFRSLKTTLLLFSIPALAVAFAFLAAGWIFGSLNVLSLACAGVVIGMVIDHPLYFWTHAQVHPGSLADHRRTVLTAAVAAGVGYLGFLFAGVPDLVQVGALGAIGLIGGGLITVILGPASIRAPRWDRPGTGSRMPRRHPGFAPLLATLSGILLVAHPLHWQAGSLSQSGLPKELTRSTQELRRALGAPRINHYLVVTGARLETTLDRTQTLQDGLERQRREGANLRFLTVTRFLPPRSLQIRRERTIPAPAVLHRRLEHAIRGLPFTPVFFSPFFHTLERSRTLPVLRLPRLLKTRWRFLVQSELMHLGHRWISWVPLGSGARDPGLARFLEKHPIPHLHRIQLSRALAHLQEDLAFRLVDIGMIVLCFVLLFLGVFTRSVRRTLLLVAPPVVGVSTTLALLNTAGIRPDLDMLIGLFLVFGLGLDYSIFLSVPKSPLGRTTRDVILISMLIVLAVFLPLVLSGVPMLATIGLTVCLGVILDTALAFSLATRPSSRPAIA
jgi:predicted exporter